MGRSPTLGRLPDPGVDGNCEGRPISGRPPPGRVPIAGRWPMAGALMPGLIDGRTPEPMLGRLPGRIPGRWPIEGCDGRAPTDGRDTLGREGLLTDGRLIEGRLDGRLIDGRLDGRLIDGRLIGGRLEGRLIDGRLDGRLIFGRLIFGPPPLLPSEPPPRA